ncbi:hypothetical protein BDV93DRAFT_443727 [Ceratobasidium sp. AG-I]|nr:hypothetical protein BDV93DRAFT_443727 [Ceratobasidium sp. AG-I]
MFGGTGVGKSSFVNDASGGNLEVGHDLYSCTKEVAKSPVFELDGRRVVLIDTPGFDDNEVSDVGTLKRIAAFMSETYGVGQRLTGIVYLHRIVDNRMGGATARTFNLFRRMCGTDTLKNVVIATNMWSSPPTSSEVNRERQLKEEFFRPALDEGARMVRRANPGRDAAHDVIRMLLGQTPRPASLRREIADARREIQDLIQQREQRAAAELAKLAEYEKEKEAEVGSLRREIELLRMGMEDESSRYRERLREELLVFKRDQQEQNTWIQNMLESLFKDKQKRDRSK